MQPSPSQHTLVVTVGGATTVSVVFDETGFNAFGARWTYDAVEDRYTSVIGWIAFDGQPNTFSANWGGSNFGGSWS